MFATLLAAIHRMNHEQFLFVVIVAVIVFLATSTRRKRVQCRGCKEVNRPGAVYCAQCGAKLRSP